jgi:hypothetical protein
MLSTENGFLKNDFLETILRQKPFYVETNGALVVSFGHGGWVSLEPFPNAEVANVLPASTLLWVFLE